MLDRLSAYLFAAWIGFKTWLVKVFSIKAGSKIRWPGIINIIPGVNKGYDFATAGEALALVTFYDYGVGAIQWAWGKLTQAPAFLLSPLFTYSESGYSWTRLVMNGLWWMGQKLRAVGAVIRRLLG
jgi:hypothetical protein